MMHGETQINFTKSVSEMNVLQHW